MRLQPASIAWGQARCQPCQLLALHVALAEAGEPLLPRVLQRLAPIELGLLLLRDEGLG